MRLNVTASTWDLPASEGRIDWVGCDVLSQTVRLTPRASVPRPVQPVVAPARIWSAGLLIDDSTSVEIHASVDRGLTPGARMIECESPQQYGRSRCGDRIGAGTQGPRPEPTSACSVFCNAMPAGTPSRSRSGRRPCACSNGQRCLPKRSKETDR